MAALVVPAAVGAALLGLLEPVPDPTPEYTLQSEGLYRVILSGVAFVIFFTAISIFVLGLNGWVISAFGPRGIETSKVIEASEVQQEGLEKQVKRNRETAASVERLKLAVGVLNERQTETELKLVLEHIARLESELRLIEVERRDERRPRLEDELARARTSKAKLEQEIDDGRSGKEDSSEPSP